MGKMNGFSIGKALSPDRLDLERNRIVSGHFRRVSEAFRRVSEPFRIVSEHFRRVSSLTSFVFRQGRCALFKAGLPLGWFAVFFTFVLGLTANAQGPAGRSCNTVDPPVSHWSADLKMGPGYASSSGFEVNFGGGVEYDVNPFLGIGLQGLYGIRQDALDMLGYGSLNLSNLTAPFRTGTWKKTNVFVVAGGGIRQSGFNLGRSGSILILAGLNGEYNLNDALALELGGDMLYGTQKMVNLTIGLRYKFGVSSVKHARNISMNEYRPQPSPIVIRQTVWVNSTAGALARLEALEKSNSALLLDLQATEERLKTYKDLLSSQEASKAATKSVSKSASKLGVAVSTPVAGAAQAGVMGLPQTVSGVPQVDGPNGGVAGLPQADGPKGGVAGLPQAIDPKGGVAGLPPSGVTGLLQISVVPKTASDLTAVPLQVKAADTASASKPTVKPVTKPLPTVKAKTATVADSLPTVKANTDTVATSMPRVKATTNPAVPQLKVANVVTGTMNPVEFLSGSNQLTPDSKRILNEMANILLTKDWKSLTITGNTDNQGDPSNNLILSLQRAGIVRSYLVSKGLPMKKLKIHGNGGSNPIESNKTPLGRRLNRRVDFVLEN